MSRLIVKNLPKTITEDKLRDIFGQHGIVTDIQLKYKDGKFRQFAYLGYKNEDDARKAIESLNNTFITTRRISVEPCASLGDSKKPKSWSKYASDSNAFKKTHKNEVKPVEEPQEVKEENETVELLEKYKNDPHFEDFLQVHKKEAPAVEKLISMKQKDVENEEHATDESEDSDVGEDSESAKLANKNISDMDYMKQLVQNSTKTKEKKVKEKREFFTIKLKGLPLHCKKKDVKAFLKPLSAQSIRVPRKIQGIAFVGFKEEKKFKKALLKNKSFLNGNQIVVTQYDVTVKKSDENNSEDIRKSKWISQEESLKNEEEIAESGRIFIRNLSYTVTEDDLRPLFEKYGPITELNLPIDTTSRRVKGFGTVTFLMPEHAVKAYTELDGSICQGRMLHLLPAKMKDTTENNAVQESTNYKQKKAAEQKAKSGQSYNWNALFLGQNAVAEVISESFGRRKEDIVGPDAPGSVAVRLALGETKIIAETKKYLEAEGVNLDAFKMANCKRSSRIILVKNLPSQTKSLEIKELFEKHGLISRIILPPSGITAVVEFEEAAEARKAFKRLAYSKFKHMPLYLEWAPEDSLKEKTTEAPNAENTTEKMRNIVETENKDTEEDDDDEPEPDTTLFVKNLNFKTTDEDLRKFFENCGKIHYATVARKKDTKNPGATLSMGYGFVRFKAKAAADKALKTMQQSVLDGKSLELKRSERILETDVEVRRKAPKTTKQNGTKILVRNVPFQANKKEIQELFTVFGEIKALRLPKKLSGESHRGFAFVDYVANSDAKKAFEALSQSTHIYGRRLVLEWAEHETTGKRTFEETPVDEENNQKKFKKGLINKI